MKVRTVAILLVVGAVTLAMVVYVTRVVPKGELGQAREWATLQGLEVAHRGDADIQNPVVFLNPMQSPYVILGIPTRDNQRAWVILNEAAPDGSVYIIPKDRRFSLSCSSLADLTPKTKIVPEVSKWLGSNCI
jgi:hypothetical protein